MENKFPFKVLLPKEPEVKDEEIKEYIQQLHRVLDDTFRKIYQQFELIKEELNK